MKYARDTFLAQIVWKNSRSVLAEQNVARSMGTAKHLGLKYLLFESGRLRFNIWLRNSVGGAQILSYKKKEEIYRVLYLIVDVRSEKYEISCFLTTYRNKLVFSYVPLSVCIL